MDGRTEEIFELQFLNFLFLLI